LAYKEQISAPALSNCLKRVLIVDPNPLAVSIMTDLIRQVGSARVFKTDRTDYGLEMAREINPHLVITEFAADQFEGLDLVRKIRRSNMACRKVPIIVTTAASTRLAINRARDAGVHEFLAKPFTANDLYRRMEAAVLQDRDWAEWPDYVGPDRRRFNSGAYRGSLKREFDQELPMPQERMGAILVQMKAAIERVESEPANSARKLLMQAEELSAIGLEIHDFVIGQAAFELKMLVLSSVKAGGLTKANMRNHAADLMGALSAITTVGRSDQMAVSSLSSG
jgi:response regulator RpfG family c-di-GMP phosphodiesterase